MRVIFIGATSFGLRCLEGIEHLEDITIVGVITSQETFRISYNPQGVKNVLHADFRQWASKRRVPLYLMTDSMKDPNLESWIREREPDLMVVVGWYHMVPKSLRQISLAVGLHASLLPDYSGGAPLVWAMINGEKQTGITLFQMADGVDSGPVYGQVATEILPQDTIATLYIRIEDIGISLLKEYLPKIASGVAAPMPQDENKRRIFPQRCPDDGLIDWKQSALNIYNFVRAQTSPYPGAFSFLMGRKVIILSCNLTQKESSHFNYPIGTLFYDEGCEQILAVTGEGHGVVELGEVMVQGIKMSATTFLLEQLHVRKATFDPIP